MSNRTLVEINHDNWDSIQKNPTEFVDNLLYYLGSGCGESAEELEHFGVRVIGMKHHSDGHNITWGGFKEKEEEAR